MTLSLLFLLTLHEGRGRGELLEAVLPGNNSELVLRIPKRGQGSRRHLGGEKYNRASERERETEAERARDDKVNILESGGDVNPHTTRKRGGSACVGPRAVARGEALFCLRCWLRGNTVSFFFSRGGNGDFGCPCPEGFSGLGFPVGV